MEALQDQLEGLPGFGIVQDYWNEYADEKFNKDPYVDKKTGKKLRLPPDITTKEEQKIWLSCQKQAWVHDKCFLGSCGVGLDCGIGMAPLLALLFPVIGPLIMYSVHLSLIRSVNDRINIPNKVLAKMEGQIVMDLLLSLPPLLGAFFSWMNLCLSNNAATIYGYMLTTARERLKGDRPVYLGTGAIGTEQDNFSQPLQQQQRAAKQPRLKKTSIPNSRKENQVSKGIIVEAQQESGFV